MGKSACAHEAWLDRRVDRRAGQPHVPGALEGVSEGKHLCVGRAVAHLAASIPADAKDGSVSDHDGADGHLIRIASLFGIREGEGHPPTVDR